MRVARGEVEVVLRSLGYMRPLLGKCWQPEHALFRFDNLTVSSFWWHVGTGTSAGGY